MSSGLSGRTALVTGAGSGLGRGIAIALSEAGARVVLVGRDRARLESTARECPDGATRIAPADVSAEAAVAGLRETLGDEEISVLVNNAGVGGPVRDLLDISLDEWEATMASNVTSVFLMCREFVAPMVVRGGGHVIMVASVAGKRPLAGRTPYCASKAAVIALTATLAAEVGRAGVTVNSLSPGPVRSARMTRNFALEAARTGGTAADAEAAYVGRAQLGRLVEEHEVSTAVLAMLAMPGLHGADIDLSAGMVAR